MEYRELGRTGIKVSVVGIGGEGFEHKTYEQCEAIISCAANEGINFLDIYNSNPQVRSYVGRALKKYDRENFVVEGHLCSMWEDGQYRRTRDLSETVSAYEDFLERMQLSYVDIGMIHYVDEHTDFQKVKNEGILSYAEELKEKGVLRSIGLSTHNPDIAVEAVQSGLIDVILFSMNPAYDMLPASEDVDILFEKSTFENRTYEGITPKRAELYRLCQEKGVALTVMKAYGAGVLLSAAESPFEAALTPVQCIHYCLTRPGVASVMAGVESVEEVLAASAYCKASQSQKDYSMILANSSKRSFSGHCMYCGHCAPCAKKIDIALVNKYLDLASMHPSVPETIQNHYALLAHHAGECIACGACMMNCPFGVPIIERMKKSAEVFGY